jgi:hypothetical protein
MNPAVKNLYTFLRQGPPTMKTAVIRIYEHNRYVYATPNNIIVLYPKATVLQYMITKKWRCVSCDAPTVVEIVSM